jgi:LysR family hydrogen peroxide-inducible transcriptional activator
MTLSRLSLRDLEYVVAVAEHGHFGRAAKHCSVSQPALSEQIHKLEESLGVVLFERSRRGVFVTPAAAPIVAQARRTVAEGRRLLEFSRTVAGELSGELRLWSIATLGPYLIPHLLRPVRDWFPRARLVIGEGLTEQIVNRLCAGEIDAAFVALPLSRTGLTCDALFFEPFMVVFPRGHEIGRSRPVNASALHGRDLLLLDEGHCLRDQVLALCHAAPTSSHHAANLETIRHLIAAGAGYSIVPALAASDRRTFGGLVDYAEFAAPDVGRSIALVWRASDPRGAHFRRLGGLVRESPAIAEELGKVRAQVGSQIGAEIGTQVGTEVGKEPSQGDSLAISDAWPPAP